MQAQGLDYFGWYSEGPCPIAFDETKAGQASSVVMASRNIDGKMDLANADYLLRVYSIQISVPSNLYSSGIQKSRWENGFGERGLLSPSLLHLDLGTLKS